MTTGTPSLAGPDDLRALQSTRAGAWASLFTALILAGLVVVVARVIQLKTWPDPRLATAAGTSMSGRPELSRRGSLLDRRGRVIATSTVGQRLFVDPQAVDDPVTIAVDLARVIGGDPVQIDRVLSERSDRRYVVVRDRLESWQVDAVRAAQLRGVGLEPRLVRHYPQGDLAAGVVGLVGFEHSGLSGFEHTFESMLRPTPGRLAYRRDVRRRPMWVAPTGYEPGRSGADVRLSIDLVIQEIAERHLEAAVTRQHSGGGRLVVLDCRTGELLAIADRLNPRPGWEEQTDDPSRERHLGLGRNRCVSDPYEPGSTFKPFIWAMATRLGKADLEEALPTPASGGHRTSRGRLIRDAHYTPDADWRTVLIKSLNSGMAIVAERMTPAEMQEAVGRFGFGRRTRCGIRGESPGIVTPPAEWTHYTQTSVAMGHEIAVTPVQMVRAFSVFARDGTMPQVRLTALEPGDDGYRFVDRVLPETVARTVREALTDVMVEGTGRRARSDRFTMFGKSGTAQLPRRDGGGYHEDRYVSSFVAAAPARDPQVVVLCVLDDPDKALGHFGGAIAGPVVRDVIEETLSYLGVPEESDAGEGAGASSH